MNIEPKKNASCAHCQAAPFCLPVGLDNKDLIQLDKLVKRRYSIKKGEHLFREGQVFRSFYAVKQGAFKSYVDTLDGREQILGFYVLGEILGLDGLKSKKYPNALQALEDSMVCEIPYESLLTIAGELPSLQRHIFQLMSERLTSAYHVLPNSTAEERLILFFLSLSKRMRRAGFDELSFKLPMTRQDIAHFLGLAIETVSRLVSHLQSEGLLQAKGKHICLLKPQKLHQRVACLG